MTRILFWNIENFSKNKISHESLETTAGHGGLSDWEASRQRLEVIASVVLDTAPDVFVIVEVCTGDTGVARSLITDTGGARGCRELLDHLRTFQADWRLVPPIIVGTGGLAESVAVFYRGATATGGTRYFTGPDRWLGATTGGALAGAAVAYVAPWDVALQPAGVAVRNIPAASAYNAGLAETQAAARIVLPIFPPPPNPFSGMLRKPYLCTFFETGGGAADRNISLVAIHAPPDYGAPAYLAAAAAGLAADAPAAGETRVVAGDFNVNLLTAAGAWANPYAAFAGYTPLLSMPAGFPGVAGGPTLDSYLAYATTHIKPKKIFGQQCAAFMTSAGEPSAYPGLRYFGAAMGGLYSIDNLLVTPAPAVLANCRTTVVNVVTGVPYVVPAAAVAPDLTGTVPNVAPGARTAPSYFNTRPGGFPWGNVVNGTAPNFDLATSNELRSWANYGRLRSVSDHFAICADV